MDKDIAAAAIERLEAEKRRRIDEKVARGEAIFVDLPVVVVGAEDADEALEKARAEKIAELRATGERREILFDDALINVIATGVPGRDEGDGEVMPIATALEDKTSPSIADFSARRQARSALEAADKPMPTTPPPSSSTEPAELVVHHIRVQVAPPTDTDPGAIVEGSYTLTEDGVLRVYDVDHNLLGTEHLAPGADAGAAARRVLREKKSPGQFWGTINYTTH
jgi:hypothetical protein